MDQKRMGPRHYSFVICFLSLILSYQNTWALPPPLAGALSVVPGLGQAVNGHPLEGLAWLGTVGALWFSGNSWLATDGLLLWEYNMYDAYRDAGAKNADKHNVFQNYIAAFNPLNVIDPVGAPIIGYKLISTSTGPYYAPSKVLAPFQMAFIGLGEEGLFRGFIFPWFSDLFFGSYIVGGISSSLAFAAFHGLYSGQSSYAFKPSVFIFRSVFGGLWALQAYLNKFDLRKNIFSHTWFDVIYDWKTDGSSFGPNQKMGLGQGGLKYSVGVKFDF